METYEPTLFPIAAFSRDQLSASRPPYYEADPRAQTLIFQSGIKSNTK